MDKMLDETGSIFIHIDIKDKLPQKNIIETIDLAEEKINSIKSDLDYLHNKKYFFNKTQGGSQNLKNKIKSRSKNLNNFSRSLYGCTSKSSQKNFCIKGEKNKSNLKSVKGLFPSETSLINNKNPLKKVSFKKDIINIEVLSNKKVSNDIENLECLNSSMANEKSQKIATKTNSTDSIYLTSLNTSNKTGKFYSGKNLTENHLKTDNNVHKRNESKTNIDTVNNDSKKIELNTTETKYFEKNSKPHSFKVSSKKILKIPNIQLSQLKNTRSSNFFTESLSDRNMPTKSTKYSTRNQYFIQENGGLFKTTREVLKNDNYFINKISDKKTLPLSPYNNNKSSQIKKLISNPSFRLKLYNKSLDIVLNGYCKTHNEFETSLKSTSIPHYTNPKYLSELDEDKSVLGGLENLKTKLRKGYFTFKSDQYDNSEMDYKTFDKSNVILRYHNINNITEKSSYVCKDYLKIQFGMKKIDLDELSRQKRQKETQNRRMVINNLLENLNKSKHLIISK